MHGVPLVSSLYLSFTHSLLAHDVGLKLSVLNNARVVGINHLEEWVHILALDADLQLCDQVCDLINSETTRLVQVEVVEDLSQQVRVLSGQLEDTVADFL